MPLEHPLLSTLSLVSLLSLNAMPLNADQHDDPHLWLEEIEGEKALALSLIHISEPTRHICLSRMPSSA